MITVAIIVIVVAPLLIVLYLSPVARRDRATLEKLTEHRTKRTDEDYCNAFFRDSAVSPDVVSKVREIFNEELGIDLRGLEPDDDLSADYSAVWGMDSMADVNIVVALEQHYDISISNAEAEQMRCIRDIAQTVSAKLRNETDTEQDESIKP